jgi:hypothetical protein
MLVLAKLRHKSCFYRHPLAASPLLLDNTEVPLQRVFFINLRQSLAEAVLQFGQ